MRHAFTLAGLASRLLLVGLCLAVAACATKRAEQPHYPWPGKELPLPPIVVRPASLELATAELSSAGGKATAEMGHNLLVSGLYFFMFPVGPLFTLVAIPMALSEGQAAYRDETHCLQFVRDAVGDVPTWFRSTFGDTPVAQLVAEGARSQLNAGGPAIVVLEPLRSAEERSAQLKGLGIDLGANTLVVADVQVLFGGTLRGNCDLKMTVQAKVRVQPVGQPEASEPRYTVSAEQVQVPLSEWAAHPAHARRQLDDLLTTLGRKLVASYADRMECAERPCEWQATERVQSGHTVISTDRCAPIPPSAGPEEPNAVRLCLLDPQACPVRCDFTRYESCVNAKPDQRYRCVP